MSSDSSPQCPKCNGPMVKRTNAGGPFWGCKKFPVCRGTLNIKGGKEWLATKSEETPQRATARTPDWKTKAKERVAGKVKDALPEEKREHYEPLVKLPGSDEQEAIWDFALGKSPHMVINAGPGCLIGNTLIDCPRDMDKYPAGIPIRDLVGQTPWVYGYSTRLKRVVIRKAVRVWKTGEKVPVYKVTFRSAYSPGRNPNKVDPPQYVIGTADHPFLLRVPPKPPHPGWNAEPPIPGGWRELKKLKPGDRVIAFLREFNTDYTYVRLNDGTKEIESRFILSEIQGKRGDEYDAHHKNERKHDNSPDNLEWKTKNQHHSDHFTDNPLPGWQGTTGIHPKGMAGKPQTRKQKKAARRLGKIRAKGPRGNDGRFVPVESNHIVEKVEFYGHEDVYNMTVEGCHNFIANGVVTHNTGKTWTMIQYCLRAPKEQKILFVAFNKHIAKEANGKLRASKLWNVKASTYHSFGNRIVRAAFKSLVADPNEDKVTGILEYLCPVPSTGRAEWRRMLNTAEKLAGHAKNYLLNHEAQNFRDELERIADHHGIELNGHFGQACDLVKPTLKEDIRRAPVSIDFDDMIWLPVVLDLPNPDRIDVMITDEVQDLNAVQHAMAIKYGIGQDQNGRIMIVGDRHQAIYGFRGALTASIETLTEKLKQTARKAQEFPLTITRRCPKLHVMLAQNLFPEIRALEDAPLGEILQKTQDEAVTMMKPGDLVICRVNKELIPCAYALIRRGIKPIIKGRDIGEGLIALLDSLVKHLDGYGSETTQLRGALGQYRYERESKFLELGDKAQGRLIALQEKCDCLLEFINNSTTIAEVRSRIDSIFTDKNEGDAVVLGTVHRTKGLESERVFILAPDLIPHPMAKKEWEREQEKNLCWVAATRAKFDNKTGAPGTIIFCGPIPAIYAKPPAAPEPAPTPTEKAV